MLKKKKKLVNFCPRCGSKRVIKDMPRAYLGIHRLCLSCGRRWEIILDKFNDYGIG